LQYDKMGLDEEKVEVIFSPLKNLGALGRLF
jgi:hypothetical protein